MAGTDDLLSPDEIEALMAAARGNAPAPASTPKPAAAKPPSPPKPPAAAATPAGSPFHQPAERTIQEAQQHLAEAMAGGSASRRLPPNVGSASPFEYQDFGGPAARGPTVEFPIAALQDVELDLRIELGRTELLIEEVLQLREGAVVPLDKLAGDPVDILVNGRLIARGEVLVLNDNFCVRVAEILAPQD